MRICVPRVPWRTEMLVGAPAAIGELNGVGLAEIDHARRHQLAHQRGGVWSDSATPCSRPAHGDLALDLHEVLDRDRNAMKWTDGMPGSNGLVGSLGGKSGLGWRAPRRRHGACRPGDQCEPDSPPEHRPARGEVRRSPPPTCAREAKRGKSSGGPRANLRRCDAYHYDVGTV